MKVRMTFILASILLLFGCTKYSQTEEREGAFVVTHHWKRNVFDPEAATGTNFKDTICAPQFNMCADRFWVPDWIDAPWIIFFSNNAEVHFFNKNLPKKIPCTNCTQEVLGAMSSSIGHWPSANQLLLRGESLETREMIFYRLNFSDEKVQVDYLGRIPPMNGGKSEIIEDLVRMNPLALAVYRCNDQCELASLQVQTKQLTITPIPCKRQHYMDIRWDGSEPKLFTPDIALIQTDALCVGPDGKPAYPVIESKSPN
jgi:hypothetical protein